MEPQGYAERTIEVAGWPLRLSSYCLGERWYAKADNVSPGACLARAGASTREQAEEEAIRQARVRLERTRRIGHGATNARF
ncbi:MAG: hypothetical protein JWO66_2090 [Candidatus Eremiobacteraeota bacterium]|nr:hypothetical protein [Candidatus Eremiobacteraeota bacterium]